MVDGEILAGDASCKVPKHVKLGNGGQYKKLLYSVMNGHGQIVRSQGLHKIRVREETNPGAAIF